MEIKTNIAEGISTATVLKKDTKTSVMYLTYSYRIAPSAKNSTMQLLLPDLLLSGTKKQNREDIQHSLKKIGSEINIDFDNKQLLLNVKSLDKNQSQLLEILSDILIDSIFSPKEIARAKTTLINKLELAKENARYLADSGLRNAFYTKQDYSYSYSPEELLTELKSVTRNDLLNYHKEILNSHLCATLSGNDLVLKRGLAFVIKLKDKHPKKTQELLEESSKEVLAKNVLIKEVKSKQNIEVAIGGQLPLTKKDSDLAPFVFGLSVLGKWGGFSGRLMSTVREKEGLTYGIYAKVENIGTLHSGYWRIMTFFSPKDVKQGITSTIREIKNIEEKGITKAEYARFKEIIKTSNTLMFDSLYGVTTLVHRQLVSGLTFDDYKDFNQKLLSCSQKEINAALKKYLNSDKLTISTAGPVASVKKELQAFSK